MKAILAVIMLLLGGVAAPAADRAPGIEAAPPALLGPLSPLQNRQAQAVAASRECWRGCQMQCKADFLACGYERSGAECLPQTDACDRACQRQCRSTGNPLLDFLE
jgi:hypothetical protein